MIPAFYILLNTLERSGIFTQFLAIYILISLEEETDSKVLISNSDYTYDLFNTKWINLQ